MDDGHQADEPRKRLARFFDGHPLGPPLGEEAVVAFERRHGVTLPDPYRGFVARVGNGCPDGPPHYGLVGLGEPSHPAGGLELRRDSLSRPFPLQDAWVWEDDPDPDEGRLQAVLDGCLPLGTDGCGMEWVLIVTGPQRGHVWLLSGEGAQPWDPRTGYTTGGAGFVGWVAHWTAGRPWWDSPGEDVEL